MQRMIRWSRVLMLVLGLTAGGAVAAQGADAAPPVLPSAEALTADWWKFFSEAGPDLADRARQFEDRLESVLVSLDRVGEPHDTIRRLVLESGTILTQYVSVVSRTAPAAPPPEVALAQYSIKRYLRLVALEREVEFELDFEEGELKREADALASADKDIKNQLARYLELGKGAAERLPSGLEMIRARLLWAIATEDLRLRKARVAQLRTQMAQLTAVTEEAERRLLMTKEDVEGWREQEEAALKEVKRLEAEALSQRLGGATFADDPRGTARKREHAQKLINLEARILFERLRALESGLAAGAGMHLLERSDTSATALRTARDALEGQVKLISPSISTLKGATDRERAAAERMLTESTDSGTALASVHRNRIERADETAQSLNRIGRELAQARALLRVVNQQLVETEGQAADLLAQAHGYLATAWETTKSLGKQSMFTLNETPVTPFGLLRFTIILIIAWWISRLVRHALEGLRRRRDTMNQASIYTLNRLFHYVILVVGFLVAASSIGIDFTKFALVASAFGVGLGFGLQAIFSNFVSGLIILFERSLKVGDFVELESGVTGEVREINIRSTLVTTNDNIDMLLPNSEFVNGRVINWTLREAYRRLRVPFGVAYGTDKDLVKKAALEAAAEVPFTLDGVSGRAPQVWLVQLGDSSLNFELVVWLVPEAVKRPGTVQAAYTWAIESALRRHGIEIPFPQRDLHVRSWFGQREPPAFLEDRASAA